jgi:VWFA-related protein
MRIWTWLAVGMVGSVAWGQQGGSGPQPGQAGQAPFTLQTKSNLVLVPTEVATKKGEMIYGLTPEQFVVEDNGVPQTIKLDEDTDALGLSLVVVVQCSRAAFAQFDNMKGLAAMVDDVTGGAPRQVAVVSYGADPTLITDFTASPDKLADALGQLQPCDDGAARTLDAVDYADALFDDNKATASSHNRRAILLISETRDHGSHHKPARVIANLGRTNTVVDSVSFNPGKTELLGSLLHGQYGPGPVGLLVMAVEALHKNIPHTLAALSGGEYTNFTTEKGFDEGVHRLANRIHNFYLISFQPSGLTGVAAEPGLHRITVKVPDYPKARVSARLTYYAGDQAPPDVPESEK